MSLPSHMTAKRIKFCQNTRLEDILLKTAIYLSFYCLLWIIKGWAEYGKYIHIYMAEKPAQNGSSEIASCLWHRLKNIDHTGIKQIRLFLDGCGDQNKNQIVLGILIKWL